MAWWNDPNTKLFSCREYTEIGADDRQNLEKAEILALFFGSYQNRPSRILTRFLKTFHSNIRKVYGSRLQVIFVPMDDTEKDCIDFVKVLQSPNWLVVPWHQQATRRNVRNMYNIINFPWVTVVKNSPEAPIVTQEGKDDIQELGENAFRKWVIFAKTAKRNS